MTGESGTVWGFVRDCTMVTGTTGHGILEVDNASGPGDALTSQGLTWKVEAPMPPDDTASAGSPQSPTKRKSTGKRLRFEIFKRDAFTCQYCGAQPPDVVLVIDHITPVALGGTNDPLNLITACETCNQGKADKPLGDRIVRPDTDLLYLETQQESSEIARFLNALRTKEQRLEELSEALVQHWFVYDTKAYYAPKWLPSAVRHCLMRYGPEITEAAIDDVAGKVATGYLERSGSTDRYFYAVARNMAEAEEGE